MVEFKNGFSFCNFGKRSPLASMFSGGMSQIVRMLVSIAVILSLAGILIILFPLILACFVAGLFFFIAFICLYQAWRIYKASRNIKHAEEDEMYIDL